MVSLDLHAAADFTSGVGRELGASREGDRIRSAGTKHREEDGGKDLLEGEHCSSEEGRWLIRERVLECECGEERRRPLKVCLERRRCAKSPGELGAMAA